MNRMNGVLLALLLAAGTSAVHSQAMLRKASWDVDRLAMLLQLDEYQKSEVARVLEERQAERVAGSHEEVALQRERINDKTREQLQWVLGEEQLTRLGWLLDGCEGGLVHRHGSQMLQRVGRTE